MEETLTLQGFLETGDHFLGSCLYELSQTGLPAYGAHYEIDHLAYVTSDYEEYKLLRELLLHSRGREVKTEFGSVAISGLHLPFCALLPVSIRPHKVMDRLEVDLIELIHRPSEGGGVSTYHHAGLLPVNKVGADQLASRFPNVQPRRVVEWLDGSAAYDVLLQGEFLVRISNESLLRSFESHEAVNI